MSPPPPSARAARGFGETSRVRVLASTTSHKREPLLPTLEVFGRLGLTDVDLNLHHILELGETVADIQAACDRHNLRLWILSGGWCDFFHGAPDITRTFTSVARQVALCDAFGVSTLRLFFGRLHYEQFTVDARATIRANLKRLSDAHPNTTFVFENHDGASLHPDICFGVLDDVSRPNIRMNFDPINFAKAGVDPGDALRIVRPYVSHVHLKGLEKGQYCEFGEGDVDLAPVIDALLAGGYQGQVTVEYEGHNDGTLRLYRSVAKARKRLEGLKT